MWHRSANCVVLSLWACDEEELSNELWAEGSDQ